MLKLQDTKQSGSFFKDILGKPVATIPSKADGSFRVRLAPGNYSAFVKESKGLFTNLFD